MWKDNSLQVERPSLELNNIGITQTSKKEVRFRIQANKIFFRGQVNGRSKDPMKKKTSKQLEYDYEYFLGKILQEVTLGGV